MVKFQVIFSIVNAGFSEAAMEAAKKAGARGGTTIHGRGTASKEAEHLFNISIQPEKEIIMILVSSQDKDAIMKALYHEVGTDTPAQGIAFSMPVDDVVGISYSKKEGKMAHLGTKKIETKRLVLRKFKLTDSTEFYKNWASNSNVTKYLTWDIHENEQVTKELLKEWVPQYKNNNYYQWAIELKGTKEIIGAISIVDIDEEKENMEIGYCIGEQWWNNGYMTEAVKEVIEFLFKEVNIKTITGKADSRNKASIKVLTKCGLKYRRVENKQNKNEDVEVLVYTKAN